MPKLDLQTRSRLQAMTSQPDEYTAINVVVTATRVLNAVLDVVDTEPGISNSGVPRLSVTGCY